MSTDTMEPEANRCYSSPAAPHEVALVSIAISLKRIADHSLVHVNYGAGLITLEEAQAELLRLSR